MAIFDYSVYIMLHFPPSDIKTIVPWLGVFPQKKTTSCNNIQPVVTLYKLHPESVPSDNVGMLEMLNWPTKVCGSSSHLH